MRLRASPFRASPSKVGRRFTSATVRRRISKLIQDDNRDMDNCVETLSQDIHDLIGECFKAISCELSFLPLPNAFEFFGFDFMGRMHIRCPFRLRCMFLVDNAWHCWLLEANAEPDFKQTGDRLKPMLQRMMEDAFQLIIDPLHPFNPVSLLSVNQALYALCV